MGTFDSVKKGVVNFYVGLAEKGSETAKVGMKKLDIVGLERTLAGEERALGRKVKELITGGSAEAIATNGEVLSFVESIKKLEKDILAKRAEIEEVRKSGKPVTPRPE